MRKVLLSVFVLLCSACGASMPHETTIGAYAPQIEVNDRDPMLARVGSACESLPAHRTRRVHKSIEVETGFSVACY